MADLDCHRCKDTRNCPGKAWFLPSEIRYCRSQVIFILKNLRLLELGQYPRDPKGSSGYTELRVWVQRGKGDAYFITPAILFSDIDKRLKQTRRDGAMLRAKYCDDYSEDTIGKQYGIRYEEVLDRIESALVYCCGWRTKRVDYRKWKYTRNYRANVYHHAIQNRK